MEITKELFEKISHLSRLRFTDKEQEQMMRDMSKIISWVKKLEEVDTRGVEPMTNMAHEKSSMRKDQVGIHLSKDKVLKNAPATNNDFIRVPKVID